MTLTSVQLALLLEQQNLGRLHSWRRLVIADSNEVYIINSDIVLRANSQGPATTNFLKEAAIYSQLHATNLPIPKVLGLDVTRQIVPCDVMMLERLEGRNALQVWPALNRTEREHISYELGQALGRIHSQCYQQYGGYDDKRKQLGNHDNWRSYLIDKAAESLIALWRCEGLPSVLLYGAEEYLLRVTIPPHPEPVLVHGDFGLHNVLLARDAKGWRLSGIFDFEWALVGDAEYEFATGLLVEPDEVNPLPISFLRGYRNVRPIADGWEQRSAVYRLIYHMAMCQMVWQSYNGNLEMLRYHRGMIVDILKAGAV